MVAGLDVDLDDAEVVKGCITSSGVRVAILPGATTMRSTVPITDHSTAVISISTTM